MAKRKKSAFSFNVRSGGRRRRSPFAFGGSARRSRKKSGLLGGQAFGGARLTKKRSAALFKADKSRGRSRAGSFGWMEPPKWKHEKPRKEPFDLFRWSGVQRPDHRPADDMPLMAGPGQTAYTPRQYDGWQNAFFVSPEMARREVITHAPWSTGDGEPGSEYEAYTVDQLRQARKEIDALLTDRAGALDSWDLPDFGMPDRARGQVVRVYGVDPVNTYDLQYEVIELDRLVASNTLTGAINPLYPDELQPRDRSRAASRMQIQGIAANLQPGALLGEFNALDRGAPIIGDDLAVESGNGRTLALMMAQEQYPDQYDRYRAELMRRAADLGLDQSMIEDMRAPVLVRRRLSSVDRVAFAQEANQSAVLGMSAVEVAGVDAQYISDEMLDNFEIGDTQTPDQAIRSGRNRDFVQRFMGKLPENERAQMTGADGELTQAAVNRIKGAMFAKAFPASGALGSRIFESVDNDIKSITNGVMGALVQLAKVERLAGAGLRGSDLTIAGDVAAAINKYATLKDQGMSVDNYMAQMTMFDDDLTATQKSILQAIDDRARSSKRVRDLLLGWADMVDRSPNPNQGSLFGGMHVTKDELLARWL